MLIPKNILVPVDFSEFSEKVLKHAIDIANQFKARVYILHVAETKLIQCIDDYCLHQELIKQMAGDKVVQLSADYALSDKMVKGIEDGMIQSATRKVQDMINNIPESKDIEIIIDVKSGPPHNEIIREQKERNIDLIIMSSSGKAGLQKYFLGSTAEKVVRAASCSVMVVKVN